jgi:hypothetical protein
MLITFSAASKLFHSGSLTAELNRPVSHGGEPGFFLPACTAVLDGSWMDLGWILDGSWMDLGWILDGSWMDLGWILDSPRNGDMVMM